MTGPECLLGVCSKAKREEVGEVVVPKGDGMGEKVTSEGSS